MTTKADLHVHSKYSEQLSEQFLRKLGAAESYTEPEFIYRKAKEQGMSFVTITDHNRIEGALQLHAKHPTDTFTGVEFTVYFPEDGCAVHLLVYGLTEAEFNDIQKLRVNIYDVRDYLKERNLAHAVAHATYSRNSKLNIEKLEKLVLLFDVFEGINGGFTKPGNTGWTNALGNLTPARIEDMYRRHRIAPVSTTPWIKGLTGGSDDHAGLFIGKTFTLSEATTPESFIQSLKDKETLCEGRHSDFQSLAFTLYKVAYDFGRKKNSGMGKSFFSRVSGLLFENKPLRLRDKLALRTLRYQNRRSSDQAKTKLIELIDKVRADGAMPVDDKLELIYDSLAGISDALLKNFMKTASASLRKGDLPALVNALSYPLSATFLNLPFLATFKYMHSRRRFMDEVAEKFGVRKTDVRRTVCFIDAPNGPRDVLEALGRIIPDERDGNCMIVTSLPEQQAKGLPENVLNLPPIYRGTLPQCKDYAVYVPSVLASLKEIYAYGPDEVLIASFGPVGLLGNCAARLLNLKSTGIYNQDYYVQIKGLIEADSIDHLFAAYTRWFYSSLGEIKVLAPEHRDLLENSGVTCAKITSLEHCFGQLPLEIPDPAAGLTA